MTQSIAIHAGLFSDAKFVELSPLARLLYVGVCYEANGQKQLTWDLQTLKYRYHPGDDCDMNALEDELVTNSLVHLFHENTKTTAVLLEAITASTQTNTIDSQPSIFKGTTNDA